MKKRKIMMSVMSAALVGVVAIGGTLAYLSDTTEKVVNTFNVGAGYIDDGKHVGLWLDETLWDTASNLPTDSRTEDGNLYKDMMPGSVVLKDPTFHLTTGSTDSYVFAEVNGLDEMVEKHFLIGNKNYEEEQPLTSALNTNWYKVDGSADSVLDGVYLYVEVDEDGAVVFDEYGKPVPAVVEGGAKLEPMFNYVWYDKNTVNAEHDDNVTAQSSSEANGILQDITVRGAAVQTANLTWEQAQGEALKALAGGAELLG